jgi:hypothetical protein
MLGEIVRPSCDAAALLDFSDTTTIGVLTAVGVVFALIAAITGVVSVRQGRRAWQASSRPLLYMTAFQHPETGIVTFDLLNSGGSVALGTTILFVTGSCAARGSIGNFAAGRRLVVKTSEPMPDVMTNPSGGLLSAYEDEGRRVAQTYFVQVDDRRPDVRLRYRKRWWHGVPSDDEMFAEQFPDISLDGLTEVGTTTPMLTQP